MPTFIDAENMNRERQGRLLPIEAARQANALTGRTAQTANASPDQSGYFDDETGEYVSYFRFGVSQFGGPDVFK